MRKNRSKKLLSISLLFVMLFTIGTQSAMAATSSEGIAESNSSVKYHRVAVQHKTVVPQAGGMTYPTPWVTLYDMHDVYDLGGQPLSITSSIITSALLGKYAGPTGMVVGAVVGSLGGMFLNGKLPIDYNITVDFLKQTRILEAGLPTIFEYYERLGIYGGPANNLYQTELFYDTRTYTRDIYEDEIPDGDEIYITMP